MATAQDERLILTLVESESYQLTARYPYIRLR